MAVPEISDEAAQIHGPMGRAYTWLPCGHHGASFPDPFTAASPFHERKCRNCGIRYQIELVSGEHGCYARFVRLT